MIDVFFCDGKQRPFASVLASIGGERLIVSTFGVNKDEVFRLFPKFKKITVIVDAKVKKRNDGKALALLVAFAKASSKLEMKTLGKTHHKMAIIDNSKIIITSANLQKNQGQEFYLVADYDDINGNSKLLQHLSTAEDFE